MPTAIGPFLLQDAEDGPGILSSAEDGKFFMWSQPDQRVILVTPPQGRSQIVGHFGGYSVQQATDGPGALTVADDGKALVWNQASSRFILTTPATSDAATLGGHAAAYFLPAASYTAADILAKLLTVDGSGSTLDADTLDGHDTAYFEAAGVAATGLAAHVAAADPHVGYFLLAGRAGGQIGYGGNAANDDLTLSGTVHATKTTSYVLLQPSGGNVGIATSAPAALLQIASTDSAPTGIAFQVGNTGGVELITATADRDFSGAGNWTGTNWAVSGGTLLHTAGSTADAVLASANMTASSVVSGRIYLLTYTISGRTAGTLTPKLGTVAGVLQQTNATFTATITANADNANLIFTPNSAFDGAIDNVSIQRVKYDLTVLNNGFIGIGRTDPIRLLDMKSPASATVTMMGLYNPDTTDNNGIVISFRADTTGAGAATYKELGAMRLKYTTHDNATCASEYAFFNEVAGVQTQILTMSPLGYVGIKQASPTAFLDIPAGTTAAAAARFRVGVAPTTPNDGDLFYEADALTFYTASAATAVITDTLRMRRASSGTPAAGFGVGLSARLMSDTVANRDAGRLTWQWVTATDASRAARGKLSAFYTTTEREVIAWEANSTVPLLGFFATAPVIKQTAGANLTNNVTSGGSSDTIANFTDLTTYANDAAAIRNDIYQLARSLKFCVDGLRAYGLLT